MKMLVISSSVDRTSESLEVLGQLSIWKVPEQL